MSVSAEVQLILLIFLLYLYDCFVLAYHNEAVARRLPSGYGVTFPRNNAAFGRRLLMLLPPLTPFYPAYRIVWASCPPPEDAAEAAARIAAFRARDAALFSRLFPGTLLLAAGFLLLVPLGLHFLPALHVLAALPFLYLLIFFQLRQLRRFFAAYPAPPSLRGKFWLLAVESLVCPPCAINLARKVSLNLPLAVDLIAFAEALLPPEACQQAVGGVVERIGEHVLFAEDAEAPQVKQMRDYALRLRQKFHLPEEPSA
ncbi:MAG: hypothetical protein LBD68_01170 [Zoogloeaceae bacterium]|nr:hypothetical protein [Zoogloeaceae bacterium]